MVAKKGKKLELPVIAGCLKGLTAYLYNFTQSASEGIQYMSCMSYTCTCIVHVHVLYMYMYCTCTCTVHVHVHVLDLSREPDFLLSSR